MNYRHHFHAGNFADVMKHVLLVQLLQALRQKDKGWCYLDTHAGRGRYDLERAATGETLARTPEWPDGIGRIWAEASPATADLETYLELVRRCDRESGNLTAGPRFYPGSPWLARQLARPQDRLIFCEQHPAECAALRAEFHGTAGVRVHETDGYAAVRAMLPPAERRGLVLIDPPFEAEDEFSQIVAALREGLRRFREGIYAVWYPQTGRARLEAFFTALARLDLPPTLVAELSIVGEDSPLKLKGCGLLVLNPPWRFDLLAAPTLEHLGERLAQAPGARAGVHWLVPET